MTHHGALGERGVIFQKSVEDLIVLAHRIVDTLWRTKREDARLLNILAQLIDQPIQPLVTGDLGNEAMKTVIGIEIIGPSRVSGTLL